MRIPRRLKGPFAVHFRILYFICVFLPWLGVSSAHAAPSVVAWGNAIAFGTTPISSARQLTSGVYMDALIRNDGTTVVQNDYYFTVATWKTNVLAMAFDQVYNSYFPENTVLALRTNHTVQVGYDDVPPPPGLTNVVAIAIGSRQYLALKADGTIAAWGPGFTNVMPGVSNLVAIASGYSHFVGLKQDGTVVAWINSSVTNGFTNVPSGLSNIVAISAGNGFSAALRRDGTVVVWGSGNPLPVTNVPPGLTNVISISCGYTFAVALLGDGTVKAWGQDVEYGVTAVPAGLTNVTLISARADHTLAVVDPQPPRGPVISGTIVSNNIFSVKVPSLSGRVYYLEYVTDLSAPLWTPLPLVAGTGETLTLQDTNLTDKKRFYRVRRW